MNECMLKNIFLNPKRNSFKPLWGLNREDFGSLPEAGTGQVGEERCRKLEQD